MSLIWASQEMFASEGYIEVMEWWKETELIELFLELHIVDN
jgi:hypothetical protein